MTTPVAKSVTADGDTSAVKIDAGRYMFAIGGNFDGATATFKVNVGPAADVPVADMAYTEAKAEIVWLPACTVFLTVETAGASTDINAALSPVTLELT